MTLLRYDSLATHVLLDVPCGDAEDAAWALGADLKAAVRAVAPADDVGPAHRLLRVLGAQGAWRVEVPGAGGLPGSSSETDTVDDLSALLLTALTHEFVHSSPLLGMHAGVVAAEDGLVVMPGASGHGKTTLVAACLRAGFGYLSDEVLAVDRGTGAVHAFPRPLALGHDVWDMLGLDEGGRPAPGSERLVSARTLGTLGTPGEVRHVLLTSRRQGRPVLREASAGDAVAALLSSAFNHFRDPAQSLRRVLDIARGARTWRIGYRDAPELAAVLRDEFGVPHLERATR